MSTETCCLFYQARFIYVLLASVNDMLCLTGCTLNAAWFNQNNLGGYQHSFFELLSNVFSESVHLFKGVAEGGRFKLHEDLHAI